MFLKDYFNNYYQIYINDNGNLNLIKKYLQENDTLLTKDKIINLYEDNIEKFIDNNVLNLEYFINKIYKKNIINKQKLDFLTVKLELDFVEKIKKLKIKEIKLPYTLNLELNVFAYVFKKEKRKVEYLKINHKNKNYRRIILSFNSLGDRHFIDFEYFFKNIKVNELNIINAEHIDLSKIKVKRKLNLVFSKNIYGKIKRNLKILNLTFVNDISNNFFKNLKKIKKIKIENSNVKILKLKKFQNLILDMLYTDKLLIENINFLLLSKQNTKKYNYQIKNIKKLILKEYEINEIIKFIKLKNIYNLKIIIEILNIKDFYKNFIKIIENIDVFKNANINNIEFKTKKTSLENYKKIAKYIVKIENIFNENINKNLNITNISEIIIKETKKVNNELIKKNLIHPNILPDYLIDKNIKNKTGYKITFF